MRNVLAVIFVVFVVLTVTFIVLGGVFDRQFWLSFVPGLMENMAALAVAVFVIDRIFRKEQLEKLAQTNVTQSRLVLFVSNRFAFKILKYLCLATEDEFGKEPTLDFAFALERLRNTDLPAVLYENFMKAENKEAFAGGFSDVLTGEVDGISNALDKIYPRPDPTVKHMIDQMSFSIGTVSFLKDLVEMFKAANTAVAPKDKMEPEALDLLIRLVYPRASAELKNIQNTVVHLSQKAKANQLFIALD